MYSNDETHPLSALKPQYASECTPAAAAAAAVTAATNCEIICDAFRGTYWQKLTFVWRALGVRSFARSLHATSPDD